MTNGNASTPFFTQAIEALNAGDRRGAAALLRRQLETKTSTRNLTAVSQLAARIGEVDLAAEAMRQAVVPGSIGAHLNYWAALASYGRSDEAASDLEQQPSAVRDHPAVLHFRGNIATEAGRFEDAKDLYRRALSADSALTASWLSLAMIKTFSPDDPDLAALQKAEKDTARSADGVRAPLYYAMGKAWEDVGEFDKAFAAYTQGARLAPGQAQLNEHAVQAAGDTAVREYSAENLSRLKPSQATEQDPIFVTGLPRSGTTLVERILIGHSQLVDGAEVNLMEPALIPAHGPSIADALAYESRSKSEDPWGDIGRDYLDLLQRYFRTDGRVVDKSLGEALLVGRTLHALPTARIAWLRRSPEDVALSAFRTYFPSGLAWTNSLEGIASIMRLEDRLFDHWRAVFPDRILAVPYEELVESPAEWGRRLQEHFGLPFEAGIESSPRHGRAVRTASVAQVGGPISTARIGQANAFARHLEPFRARYAR